MEEVGRLRQHAAELEELALGQVFLPPDLVRVHRDEVVCVHDRMDESVEDNCQVDVAVIA